MQRISCVMFDFWNVIGIFDTPYFHEFILKYRRNDCDPKDIFCGLLLKVFRRFDHGDIDEDAFFENIRQAFDLNPLATKERFFFMFKHLLLLDRQMLAIRDDLNRRRIDTVLITNMNRFHEEHIRQMHPYIFSGFKYSFISHREGVSKPDPEAWIITLDHMGLNAEEAMFIDDSVENIDAARELGIPSWHYDIADDNYFQNGNLENERKMLKFFLDLQISKGILKSR